MTDDCLVGEPSFEASSLKTRDADLSLTGEAVGSVLFGVKDAVASLVAIDGAFSRSHFRCMRAFLMRSNATFSLPARKDSLTVSVAVAGEERLDVLGPGDGTRVSWMSSIRVRPFRLAKAAPQISHVRSDAWLTKVHCGHMLPPVVGSVAWAGPEVMSDLFSRDKAAMVALTTCTTGGTMPQVEHGAKVVCSFAVEGSKCDGT